MSKLNKEMHKLHKEFVKEHGHEPRYVVVAVKFDGEDEEFTDIIQLTDIEENLESDVLAGVDGINELCQINSEGIADYTITDIYDFTDHK